MTELDLARPKRLRSAASETLARVPEKSAHGLPSAYMAIRSQVVAAVPKGLQAEVSAVAPEIHASHLAVNDVIARAQEGARAYAHLAALVGWLNALTGEDEGHRA